jgi:hypothetical protein
MALVAVVSAAAGSGLSGIAFAGTGGDGNSAGIPLLGGNGLLTPPGIPDDVCGDASALLGIAVAGCRGGAAASLSKPRATDGGAGRGLSGSVPAGAEPRGGKTGDRGTSPASTVFRNAATSGPDSSALRQTFGDTLNAPGLGAGTTNNPAASQPAGLGTLPGLAELPSLNGLTNVSAGRGTPGGSTLMPSSALSAADVGGMSSDSFAALAIGALIAGAAALKIASRRARDGKAEMEQPHEQGTLGFSRGRRRGDRRGVCVACERGLRRLRPERRQRSVVRPVG